MSSHPLPLFGCAHKNLSNIALKLIVTAIVTNLDFVSESEYTYLYNYCSSQSIEHLQLPPRSFVLEDFLFCLLCKCKSDLTCPLIDINLARIIQIKFKKIVKTGTLHLFCADSGDASWPRLSPMQQIKKFIIYYFLLKSHKRGSAAGIRLRTGSNGSLSHHIRKSMSSHPPLFGCAHKNLSNLALKLSVTASVTNFDFMTQSEYIYLYNFCSSQSIEHLLLPPRSFVLEDFLFCLL